METAILPNAPRSKKRWKLGKMQDPSARSPHTFFFRRFPGYRLQPKRGQKLLHRLDDCVNVLGAADHRAEAVCREETH